MLSRTLNTKITSRDEGTGNCEDLVGQQSNVKCLGDRNTVVEDVEDRLVPGLHRQNRTRRGEEHRVVNQVRGTQVCGNSQVLYHTGGRSHCGDIVERIAKVDVAAGDGLVAKRLDDRLIGCNKFGVFTQNTKRRTSRTVSWEASSD